MKTTIITKYPQWQNGLRESQAKYSTPTWGRKDVTPEQLAEENRNGIAGKDLRFVLENIMGIPVGMRVIATNWYAVDGYWFSIKAEADGNEDKQPLFTSTSTLKNGHHLDKRNASVSFTLYVGKVNPDPAFYGWPGRKVIVERNYKLHMSNPHFVRNKLAEAIDALDAEYQAVLPRYQAWKLLEDSTPAELQDFILQTMRQAVKRMSALEILPTRIPTADEADDMAAIDGMLPKPSPTTPDDDEDEDLEDTQEYDDEEEEPAAV